MDILFHFFFSLFVGICNVPIVGLLTFWCLLWCYFLWDLFSGDCIYSFCESEGEKLTCTAGRCHLLLFPLFLVWLRVWKLCTQIWQMLTNVLVLVCFELFPTLSPDYVYAIMCCSLMTKTCSTVGRCSMSQPQACRLESCYHSEIKCSLLVIWKFIWHSPTVEGSGLHWLEFTMSWMEEFSAFLVNLSLFSFFLFFFPSVLFLFKTRNWL